jgi:hypothetical protein
MSNIDLTLFLRGNIDLTVRARAGALFIAQPEHKVIPRYQKG